MVELENIANVRGAPAGELGAGKLGDVLAIDEDFPGGGSVDSGDEVEEGCFARTRWAHEREEFAARDLKGEVLKRGDRGLSFRK